MKNSIFELLLATICAIHIFSCKKQPMVDPPVGLPEAPTLQSFPVEPGIFGFNTGSTFHILNPGLSPYAAAQNVAEHWLDSLDCRSFRFPGGRDANFYHYQGKGYGFLDTEFEVGSSDEDAAAEVAAAVFAHEATYPDGINAGIPYAEMAGRQTGHRSIFTLNILHASYEENRDAIRWLQSLGAKFSGIELGNELYLEIHRDDFPTAADYISKAKAWTAMLRADFPGLQIAACGAPVKGQGDPAKGVFFKNWNDALCKEDFFDAVTWHHYVNFETCGGKPSDPSVWECLRDSLVRETTERLPAYLSFWKSKFPNKKLWVTEWNLGKKRVEWLNSQAVAIFVTEFELEMARFSAKNGGFIEFAHHHNLLANGLFSILSPDSSATTALDKAKRSPAFLAFSTMKNLFGGSAQWLDEGGQLFTAEAVGNPLNAHPFLVDNPANSKRELTIFITNSSASTGQFSWKQADNVKFKIGSKTWQSTGFSSKTGGFKAASLGTGQASESDIERISATEMGSFAVPPLSVLTVRMEVE